MPLADETEVQPHRHGTIAWALRTAAVAGLVGVAATHYLARAAAPSADPARLAAARGAIDPETTGSIGGSARPVRLDPCTAPPGTRAGRS